MGQYPNYFGDFIASVQRYLDQPLYLGDMKVWPGWLVPDLLLNLVAILAACGVIIGLISFIAIFGIYAERKIAGHIQQRYGPMRVGWHGILQSFADGIKLFVKEDLVPDNSNHFLFSCAPVLVFIGALVPFVALPFADKLVIANMDIGLFYVLAFAALEVIGVIMAGWASNSKWSLYGGMRLAAQMMSYEIPMGLAAITVVLLAGTLNINEMVEQQRFVPYMLQSPFAFIASVIFFVGALASAKRAPFDLPEAESELVSGFHTEYSGIRFSFFFLAEYASMGMLSIVAALVFLGGWNFPIPAAGHPIIGLGQLAMKSSFLFFVMIWLRWTLPRVRIDQVMYMCLKVLVPFGLFCVVGAGVEAALGSHLASVHIAAWIACGALAIVFWLIARRSSRMQVA